MADVFISDAREDHAAAARVADLLDTRGRSVRRDRDLVPGEGFDEVIEPRDDTAISEVSMRGWTS